MSYIKTHFTESTGGSSKKTTPTYPSDRSRSVGRFARTWLVGASKLDLGTTKRGEPRRCARGQQPVRSFFFSRTDGTPGGAVPPLAARPPVSDRQPAIFYNKATTPAASGRVCTSTRGCTAICRCRHDGRRPSWLGTGPSALLLPRPRRRTPEPSHCARIPNEHYHRRAPMRPPPPPPPRNAPQSSPETAPAPDPGLRWEDPGGPHYSADICLSRT